MILVQVCMYESEKKSYDMVLVQSKVHKVYPYKYWSSMATCLVGGSMAALAGIVLRRDRDAWKLGWDLNLLTVVYSVSHHILYARGTETKCWTRFCRKNLMLCCLMERERVKNEVTVRP